MVQLASGSLALARDDWETLRVLLGRIQDSIEVIEGVRGEFTRRRWTHTDNAIYYTDANGQILHGFGNF